MRTISMIIALSSFLYANSFANDHTTKRDTFTIYTSADLELLKSYITIQILMNINFDTDYYDEDHLVPLIEVIETDLTKSENPMTIYTDEIVHTIVTQLNDRITKKETITNLLASYQAGELAYINYSNSTLVEK